MTDAPLPDHQFAHPDGRLGIEAGRSMAEENRAINCWALELLDLRPDDRVLEIGFGPGTALTEIAGIVADGLVAGVDPSAAMGRLARARARRDRRRTPPWIALAEAEALPWPTGTFSKVLSVRGLHLWPELGTAMREIERVVRPGARIVLATEASPGDEEVAERHRQLLCEAGFERVLATGPASPARAFVR